MAAVGKGLWFIDQTPKYCDFCDDKKRCAVIATGQGDILRICRDCLTEFNEAFDQ
jgi:hypothetical protein